MSHLVLIIENHAAIRVGLEKLISGLGHRVILAETVAEGSIMLKENPTHLMLKLNLRFDVL